MDGLRSIPGRGPRLPRVKAANDLARTVGLQIHRAQSLAGGRPDVEVRVILGDRDQLGDLGGFQEAVVVLGRFRQRTERGDPQ